MGQKWKERLAAAEAAGAASGAGEGTVAGLASTAAADAEGTLMIAFGQPHPQTG